MPDSHDTLCLDRFYPETKLKITEIQQDKNQILIRMKSISNNVMRQPLSEVPENELREILEQFDVTSLVIASMGASPEINNLLEKLFPDVDYKMERNGIGRVRVDKVERIQREIVSVINLQAFANEF